MLVFNKKDKRGFTMIELIIVIVLMAILSALSAPIYNKFQNTNNVELANIQASQALRRAQILSQASSGDSAWGVYIGNSQITLFKGNTYVTRDTNFDEIYQIVDSIKVSGLNEVVFEKFSGQTQNVGDIIFSINENFNKTITINGKGILE